MREILRSDGELNSSLGEDSFCSARSSLSSDTFMNEPTKKNVFTIALINARSIKPKLDSFKLTLNELGADVCLLTETWLKDTPKKINECI